MDRHASSSADTELSDSGFPTMLSDFGDGGLKMVVALERRGAALGVRTGRGSALVTPAAPQGGRMSGQHAADRSEKQTTPLAAERTQSAKSSHNVNASEKPDGMRAEAQPPLRHGEDRAPERRGGAEAD